MMRPFLMMLFCCVLSAGCDQGGRRPGVAAGSRL
jgi:hypothetical protein